MGNIIRVFIAISINFNRLKFIHFINITFLLSLDITYLIIWEHSLYLLL